MGFKQTLHRPPLNARRASGPGERRHPTWLAEKSACGESRLTAIFWLNAVGILVYLAMLAACAAPRIVEPANSTLRPTQLDIEGAIMDDGYRLPLQIWSAAGTPAIVLLGLHGFNDYANAFAPLGQALAQSGITTYAVDQRGFGATALPGRWHGSTRLAADLRHLVDLLRARHPDARLYVAGESMGGAVVLAASAAGPLPADGIILIAPAIWSRDTMPWYQRLALDGAVRTLPWLKLTGEGVRISPSDDVQMLREMGRDPLVIKATRVDALWGITDLMDRAHAAASHIQTPALLLYGEQDQIIPKNAFCRFLKTLPAATPGLRFVLYQRGWHMLPRDLQGERAREDVRAWLMNPKAPLPSGEDTAPHSDRVSAFCNRPSTPRRGLGWARDPAA